MRKQTVLILILSLSLFALFSSVRTNSDPINISLPELRSKLSKGESFIVQIELEGCPACEELRAAERSLSPSLKNDIEILVVPKSQKEVDRETLKALLPSFEFYPSIFAISEGKIASEFDLSTLDSFEMRFTDWRLNLNNTAMSS